MTSYSSSSVPTHAAACIALLQTDMTATAAGMLLCLTHNHKLHRLVAKDAPATSA